MTCARKGTEGWRRFAASGPRCLLALLAICLVCAPVLAAETSQGTYVIGESVLIRTTSGATALTIRFGDQAYRFLGEPDPTISYQPSEPGEYLIQETIADGAVIETRFLVQAVVPESNGTGLLPEEGLTIAPASPEGVLDAGINEMGLGGASLMPTKGAIGTVASRVPESIQSLERDERPITAINPGIRIRTGRGTAIAASFTVRPDAGGLQRGSTDDLGARLPTSGKAEVSFDMADRHVRQVTLRGVDLAKGVDLGIDDISQGSVGAPIDERAWVTVYAVDPTNLTFTDGELRAVATGTELYKCRTWDFDSRLCPGSWEKVMDIVPGQEYAVHLDPLDPGFAEAVTTIGYSGETGLSGLVIAGSIPVPVETAANQWGAVIFNPTNRTISISHVRFTANQNLFGGATGVVPSTGWGTAATRVNWSGSLTLGPRDAAEFIVNAQGVSSNLNNINIELNATTNDTNLTTNGYTTFARNANIQGPSVYFANATAGATYLAANQSPDEIESFIVTVDNGAGVAAVSVGTVLMIRLPAEWRNVSVPTQTGWAIGTVMGDEGSGIFLSPSVTSTTIGAGASRNFTFTARPPELDGTALHRAHSWLLGPGANLNLPVATVFSPALRTVSAGPGLLDADDDRYSTTRSAGGSTTVDQYISVPSPIDSVASNTWGVAVVNPTDQEINVTQIDIQTSSNVFGAAAAIHPAATWSLQSASDVRWNGTVTIPPHSARSFAVNITATATSTLLTTVTFTTVTTAGTLTATGPVTSMTTGNIQHPSLYGVNATGQTFVIDNLTPSRSEQFRIRVSNRGASAAIPVGTSLEIIVPAGWKNITAAAQTNWTINHVHTDATGGGLIKAVTATNTIANGITRDFVFNATPPSVGTNSTYRFDVLLIGESERVATQIMESLLQLAATVVPPTYGISINRTSEVFANVSNISSLRILDVVKANQSTFFNLSILNTRTGAFNTVRAAALGTTEENWIGNWTINRTFDVRDYVNATTGRATIKWTTTSPNATALHEDYLTINITYDITLPMVVQVTPNETFWNQTNITLYFNASDDTDLRNCTIFINGTTNQTSTTILNDSANNFTVGNLSNRRYFWSVSCYDLNDHRNSTVNRTFIIDTVLPRVNLTAPTNQTKFTVSTVPLTIVANDTNLANCTLIIGGVANQTNLTPGNTTVTIFNVTLPDGNTTWTAECADLAGNVRRNTSSRIVQVDTAAPTYTAITTSPASGGTYNLSQRYNFSSNWSDANGISTVVFESNITGTLINRTVNLTSGATRTYNFSTLPAGNFQWRMYANDSFGNWNATPIQTFDIIRAESNITLLLNGTVENYPVDINESVNITGILVVPSAGRLEIHINGLLHANGTAPFQNITSFGTNGTRNITLHYNTTQNYTASNMTLRITVGDKIGPTINQTHPANNSYVSAVNITFLFNLSDATGVENCTLFINGTVNGTNLSGLVNDGENSIRGGPFAESEYNWTLQCADSIGNVRNSSTLRFGVDRTPPAVFNLLTPANETVSAQQSPTFVWQASSDQRFLNYTLLIDNAVDFSSPNYLYVIAPASNTSFALPDVLASGTTWHWKVVAYDTAGNARESNGSYTYTPDIDPPTITVQSPANASYISMTSFNITYLIGDVGVISNCTLAWNDTTTQLNTTLNQSGTNRFTVTKAQGAYRFNITCSDGAGNNAASDQYTVTVDTDAPSPVDLLTPANGTFSNDDTPLLTWTQSADVNFANYTVIVSDNESFPYANHTYLVTDVGTALYQVVSGWVDGTWWWKVIVYDLAGNSADPGFLYIIDSTPPDAFGLLTPVNETASTNRSPTLTWEESADANFDNYTILVSSYPDLSLVNFTYSTTESTTAFLDVPSPWNDNTVWYWRVVAWDNATNSRNSTGTYRYTTDSLAPNLTLLSPPNNTVIETNSSLVTFTYNITDLSGVASCTLTINDSVGAIFEDIDPFVDMNENETFVEALQTGNYNWSIACTDLAGNNVTSARRMLSVNVTLPTNGWFDTAAISSPQENASANTSAMAVYGVDVAGTVVPRYRTWNGTAWSAEGTMPDPGSSVRWIRVVSSPLLGRAEEHVAAMVGDDGNIDAYAWNGTNWTLFANVGSIGTTRNAQRSFDLAYERQRGRAMLLYSIDSTNAAQDLAYRIWNGSDWNAQVTVNDPSSAADMSISFIRLAARPENSSNILAAAYIDVTNSDARAMIWNGTTWGTHVNITTTISITTEEDVAVEYEQQRKGALAIAGTGSTVAFAYFNGSSWNQTGSTDVNPSAAGTTNWLTLSANPAGNELMVADVDSGNDMSTAQWLDGAWSGALRHDADIDTDTQRPTDFAWEPDGNEGLLVWGTVAGQLAYREYSVSSSWFGPSNIATGANAHAWVTAISVPTVLSAGARILVMTEESLFQLDGAMWTGAALTDQNAAFTTSQGSVTYLRFDISTERYPPRPSQQRNVTLNRSVDGAGNIIGAWTSGGVVLVSNATSPAMGNYSARGFYMPQGASVRFSSLLESMNPGISYLTWEAYLVNSSGQYLICSRGNRTRTGSDVQVSSTAQTTYTGTCVASGAFVLGTGDLLRVQMWANSSANNTLTKYIDSTSTFADFEGYPIGNLTASVVAPTSDPRIGEGGNVTFICQIGCSNGYCIDVRISHEINSTLTAFNATDYFTGNIRLNESAVNPLLLGNINVTTNATFNLTGEMYSYNNTLRCNVTSLFQNVTSNLRNVSVLDNIAPNITLLSPPNATGYDPGNITFTINASDRRLGLCSLWTNTTGTWTRNQTITPNNYTLTNFSSVNVSAYGTYSWNVNCSDLSGNDTFSRFNFTFVIAGDLYVNSSEITFLPASPVEGENVTIRAVIRNRANRIETNVNVSFFLGDPDDGGTQIGENQTIASLAALGNATVNVSLIAAIGSRSIYVIVDPPYGNGSVFESDEVNNRGQANMVVLSWQLYYGNVSGNITLAAGANTSLTTWFITNQTGNIYITDTDTTGGVNFGLLRALGRNTTGGASAGSVNDFTDLDSLLNGTNYTDNINATYTSGGSPILLDTITVRGASIANVPFANSTAAGNHTTGILWDADDSSDSFFDQTDNEDVVFVTRINRNKTTSYGVADYAIKVPAKIKSYKAGTDTVTIYYEIA